MILQFEVVNRKSLLNYFPLSFNRSYKMVLLKLFITFLKIGFFAFGGAYSFLPLVEREVVQNHCWLEGPEFLEVVGIARVFPGAISIGCFRQGDGPALH